MLREVEGGVGRIIANMHMEAWSDEEPEQIANG